MEFEPEADILIEGRLHMHRRRSYSNWTKSPARNSRCVNSNRAIFECLDCGVNTHRIREYYMVRNSVWDPMTRRVWKWVNIPGHGLQWCSSDGMLCVGCLEQRLGRTLTYKDFTNCLVNRWHNVQRSIRLQQRMMSNRSKPIIVRK